MRWALVIGVAAWRDSAWLERVAAAGEESAVAGGRGEKLQNDKNMEKVNDDKMLFRMMEGFIGDGGRLAWRGAA